MSRLFGTDGVRGIVGDTMTPELAQRLGQALGTHLGPGATVAVGRDARLSGPMLATAVMSGILSTGVNVVRLGICPTPAIQFYAAKHENVKAAVIVTASHNPGEWNGLKYIHGDGTEAGREDEEHVEALYGSQKFHRAAWRDVGQMTEDKTANDAYIAAVQSKLDVAAIKKRKFKVVVDAAGGPGALTSPRFMESMGATVVPLLCELDGTFSGRKPEPTEDNLSKLKATVAESKADFGIAHDGDADRCVFVDDQGHFVPGDQSFALLARHMMTGKKDAVLCTPVSTSSLVEEVVQSVGGRVVSTAVGSPIVARRMRADKAAFGGEENGGLIFPDHQYCRDALMTAARMMELLAKSGKSLSSLRSELPNYTVVKTKLSCPDAKKPLLMKAVKGWIRKKEPSARVDETDGIKIFFPEGWVLARPSGTEPIFRVYAESKKPERAQSLAKMFVDEAQRLVATL